MTSRWLYKSIERDSSTKPLPGLSNLRYCCRKIIGHLIICRSLRTYELSRSKLKARRFPHLAADPRHPSVNKAAYLPQRNAVLRAVRRLPSGFVGAERPAFCSQTCSSSHERPTVGTVELSSDDGHPRMAWRSLTGVRPVSFPPQQFSHY